MADFTNVNKRDPKVQIKTEDTFDKNNRLPCNYRSNIGFDTLSQNVLLKELINRMGNTKID